MLVVRRGSIAATIAVVAVLGATALLTGCGGGSHEAPHSSTRGTVPAAPAAPADAAAIAERVARHDPSTGPLFTRGGATVGATTTTNIEPGGPGTAGVVLILTFPKPYSFSGSFPEIEPSKDGERLLRGTMRLEATRVSRLWVAVDVRTRKVVNVFVDPTDLGASTRMSSTIPGDQIGGD